MGFDGFALNVGDPTQGFVRQTFDYMFDYARDNYPDFKLFMSMDLWAEGNAFNGVDPDKYNDLLEDFRDHNAWLQGPDGNPFLSTYSSGGMTGPNWTAWKSQWSPPWYFVPDIDDTNGYNTRYVLRNSFQLSIRLKRPSFISQPKWQTHVSDFLLTYVYSAPGWWDYWGDIIDGVMSWETAWPKPEVEDVGNITIDEVIIQGTFEHRKAYMMRKSTALTMNDSL